MGLVKITPSSKSVTKTLTWNFTAPQTAHTTYTQTKSGTTDGTVTASTSFNSATSSRLCNSSGYWTIVKATGESASETVSLGTVTTVADDWSQSVSGVGYGKYTNYYVYSTRTFQNFVANFPYNSSKTYYQITLPSHGPYKLEVCGASAASSYGTGGKGGYTYGIYTVSSDNEKLYVCVGGIGTNGGNGTQYYPANTSYAGFNGGGYGQAGGGGATHIAQILVGSGVLSAYESYKDYVLLVGGGAGNADWGTGGHGGGGNGSGTDGIYQNVSYGRGGTATAGGQGYGNKSPYNGSFGQGGNTSNGSSDSAPGGGGGWYGGGASTVLENCPSGGGSGHINTNKITNSGGTTGASTQGANGYAKISL